MQVCFFLDCKRNIIICFSATPFVFVGTLVLLHLSSKYNLHIYR